MWELVYKRKLSTKDLMLSNCSVGEDSWVPGTVRSSKESIQKEISPEYSLEGLTLKLKHQYFGHLIPRPDLLERPWCRERLKAEVTTVDKMYGWHHWLGRWWRTERLGVLRSTTLQRVRHDWATEQHSNFRKFPSILFNCISSDSRLWSMFLFFVFFYSSLRFFKGKLKDFG